MNMRRMILRRGLGLLGAGALLDSGGIRPSLNMPPSPPATGTQDGSTSDHDARRALAEPFWKKRRKIEREIYLRQRCWNEQDPDLCVLQSTSRAWRASVMHTRLSAQISIIDELERRVSAIWEEPFEKIKEIALSWIRGDA